MECERETAISSEENDRLRTRRMYECTFCKRGFTNAQALGGHMNIHRRDRAKAKQNTDTSNSFDEEYSNITSTNNSSSSDHSLKFRSVSDGRRYFQASGWSSPRQRHEKAFFVPRPKLLPSSLNNNDHELLGANLSLGIGPLMEINENHVGKKGNDLDLELRLGHDP